MPVTPDLFIYALIPGVAMIIAGLWAVLRAPNEVWRSALMHFAADVVFAVVAMEFLPDLVEEHSIPATVVGFALGTIAMLAVREWSSPNIVKLSQKRGAIKASLIAATAIDMVVDGLMLGVGFAAGLEQGLLLTVALALELVPLGLAVTLELQEERLSRARILWTVAALAGLFVLSAVLGSAALSLLSGAAFVGVIAFGTAALLFLVTEELLTEAHEVEESPWLTATFFVGFLVILLLELG